MMMGGGGVDDVMGEGMMDRERMMRNRGGLGDDGGGGLRLSWAYCLLSVLVAVLAVVTSSSSSSSGSAGSAGVSNNVVGEIESMKMSANPLDVENVAMAAYTAVKNKNIINNNKQHSDKFLRWLLPHSNHNHDHNHENNKEQSQSSDTNSNRNNLFWKLLIDPALLTPDRSTLTDVIDKVLTSTPRLLAIANLLLAATYLLHSAIADLFLGHATPTNNLNANNNNFNANYNININHRRAGRERLGGFLLFKLLLISAVVEPDTLDLLILLSWYTLLSFLRSLAHLANATTSHTSQSGQPPPTGVLRLLLLLLIADMTAATSCFLLFYEAGPGMVFLLQADTALLAIDILSHIIKHFIHKTEETNQINLAQIEQQQITLHSNNSNQNNAAQIQQQSRALDTQIERLENYHNKKLAFLDTIVFTLELTSLAITVCHFLHIWSLHGLSFGLVDCVLALHLHTAISAAGKKIAERRNLNKIHRDLDGYFQDATELEMRKAAAAGDVCCICLGTMSASNVKKVACGHLYHTHCLREVVERARSIHAARCPLCRSSIVNTDSDNNNNNSNSTSNSPTNNNNDTRIIGRATPTDINNPQEQPQQQQQENQNQQQINAQPPPIPAGEHALFRFSTEGILPAWLPLPAFSFEVVRRPSNSNNNNNNNNNNNADANNNNNQAQPATQQTPQTQQQQQQQQQQPSLNDRNDNTNNQTPQLQQQNNQQGEMSFWRRLLILAGAIPMSPEEETAAITQLVDMFPQYQRADLLRELRDRGSPEAVVEAVLTGVFSGAPLVNTADTATNQLQPTIPARNDDVIVGNQENNNGDNIHNDHTNDNTQNDTTAVQLVQEQQRSSLSTTTAAAVEEEEEDTTDIGEGTTIVRNRHSLEENEGQEVGRT